MTTPHKKNELINHDFDGIHEFDNVLPPWWLSLFYFTMIWGALYLIHYHVLHLGYSSLEEYRSELRMAGQNRPTDSSDIPVPVLERLTDESDLKDGKNIFKNNCQACHGEWGQGGVGPNLTDAYWIHGGTFVEVMKTIREGVPAKGMVAWQGVLKPREIQLVASYILNLSGTNPPGAKAAEGSNIESP